MVLPLTATATNAATNATTNAVIDVMQIQNNNNNDNNNNNNDDDDDDNEVAVADHHNSKPKQLFNPQTAYIMTNILSDVIYGSRGTGARARSLKRPAAGKTGSTSDYFDAWFMGYTAQIAAGVWIGFDQERTLGRGEVGGRSALPIWTEYMKKAHKDLPKKDFQVPEGIIFTNIDIDTGKLVGPNTKRVAKQAFKADFVLERGAEVLEETVEEGDLFEEDFE